MSRCDKFVLSINLETPQMQDQHDVAGALRTVADQLNKYVSSNWGPYARSGTVYDRNKNKVGTWEVKGPYDDRDE